MKIDPLPAPPYHQGQKGLSMNEEQLKKFIEESGNALIDHVPHAKAVGMNIISGKPNHAWLSIPYAPHLVGNPDTGVIHGGVTTTLLDNASGIATQLSLPERVAIATLDLRIDYMRPAEPGEDIFAHAHCYKVTKNIAFVRGTAYHGDNEDDPIATSVATFMLAANRSAPMPISAETALTAKKGDA